MSNRFAFLLALVLSLAPSALAADGARSEWVGLWSLTQLTPTGPVQLHFHVQTGNAPPTLYGSKWERLSLSDYRIEDDHLLLNWLVSGFNLALEGRRKLDRVSGSWRLVHPQYAQKGEFTARRLFPDPDWSPLKGLNSLRSASPLIDLNAYLLEKLSSEDDFSKFWEITFRRGFYAFWADPPNASQMRRLLQQPRFEKRATAFAAQYNELVDAARRQLSGMSLSMPVLAVPFGGDDPAIVWVDKKPYLVVNADRFAQNTEESRSRAYFAEKMLEANLRFTFPQGRGPAIDLWKQGLPAYFTVKTDFAEADEVLALSSDELEELESNLAKLKRKQEAGKPVSKQERSFLAYDFIASVAKDRPAFELVGLRGVDINQAYVSYLRGDPIRLPPSERRPRKRPN